MEEVGIARRNLTVARFPGVVPGTWQRGLRTEVAVERGDLLLTVPRSVLLTPHTARQGRIGEVLKQLSAQPVAAIDGIDVWGVDALGSGGIDASMRSGFRHIAAVVGQRAPS